MRNRLYILMFLILSTFYVQAQIVNSTCVEAEDAFSSFDLDASRLALRHVYAENDNTISDIEIDVANIQLFKDALWAVHNADELTDVQEVISFYEIQTHSDPELQSFQLSIDTSFIDNPSFYNNPIAGLVDSASFQGIDFEALLDTFDLIVDSAFFESIPGSAIVTEVDFVLKMRSGRLLNLAPLMEMLLEHALIVETEILPTPNKVVTDITSSVTTEYVELVYHYNYDCNDEDCLQKHNRKFRIYNDCSVEYMGEYGDPLPTSELKSIFTLFLFPNPVADKISLNFLSPPDKDFTLRLHNSIGELIQVNEVSTSSGLLRLELTMATYPVGVYFLSLQNEDQILTEKIVKKY